MPPKIKSDSDRKLIRSRILDAARDLFVEKGVQAVTMREIAKRIGYSPTAIYLHFKDKESLLQELCNTDFLALADNLSSILEIKDPIRKMVELGKSYAHFALSHPNHYRLLFMTSRPVQEYCNASDLQHTPNHDAYSLLKQVVDDVFVIGAFASQLTDPELIAQTIWAGIHGVCSLEIVLGNDSWIEWRTIDDRITLMQSALLNGLLKETL